MSSRTRQKNIGDVGTYRMVDHIASRTVRSLSSVIGVKNVMRPFWNRWRESRIGEETIMRFLDRINSIDEWPETAMELVREAEAELDGPGTGDPERRVAQLRRLSYLAHLAQWGCMDVNDIKLEAYRKSRDYYVEAESLAWGEKYHRVGVRWGDGVCYGNLHLPQDEEGAPLVVILHGMDDSKEEHLATELVCQEAGFAVLGIDGPGQGEALYLDGMTWTADFHRLVSAAVDEMSGRYPFDPERVGVIGISFGGTWAIKAAAEDQRVRAVYDLGGPIDLSRWNKLPYFLKTKACQVLGGVALTDMPGWETVCTITDRTELDRVRVPVRIIHGGKDPLIPVRDKEWLRQALLELHPDQDVTLHVFDDGDHCCTAYGSQIRADGAKFFQRTVTPPQLSGRSTAGQK
jgi:dienelactone hydrolase